MASVCAICQSNGRELVFEDPEEYGKHCAANHNPVPLVPAERPNEPPHEHEPDTELTERFQIVGEALESIQQRLVNAFTRIEALENEKAGLVSRLDAIESRLGDLNPASFAVSAEARLMKLEITAGLRDAEGKEINAVT